MFANAFALTLLAFGVAGSDTSPKIEPVKLAHVFAVDQSDSYRVKAKLEGGMDIEVGAELDVTISKILEDGMAEGEVALKRIEVMINGSPTDSPFDPIKTKFDKFGMPLSLENTQEVGMLNVMFACSNYLPGADVEVGTEYTIDWSDSAKVHVFKGKGQLLEIKEKDGKKVAVVKNAGSLKGAEGQESPFESTGEFWMDSGRMIKADGKLTIEMGTLTFSFSQKL